VFTSTVHNNSPINFADFSEDEKINQNREKIAVASMHRFILHKINLYYSWMPKNVSMTVIRMQQRQLQL